MLSDDRSMEYGMWGDKYNRLAADRDYYSTDANNAFNKDYGMWGDKRNMLVADRDYYSSEANNAFNRDYSMYSADRTLAHGEHTTSEGYKYQDVADANAFAQWKANYDESVRQYNTTLKFQETESSRQLAAAKAQAKADAQKAKAGNDDFHKATFSRVDDSGNNVFYINGKEHTFAPGINPYTGSKNPDIKNGTFSNGYQPNNIGGEKLSKTGETDVVNGVTQNVWKTPDGTKWIWDGTQNKYLRYED
jgi:hypothetical protein